MPEGDEVLTGPLASVFSAVPAPADPETTACVGGGDEEEAVAAAVDLAIWRDDLRTGGLVTLPLVAALVLVPPSTLLPPASSPAVSALSRRRFWRVSLTGADAATSP